MRYLQGDDYIQTKRSMRWRFVALLFAAVSLMLFAVPAVASAGPETPLYIQDSSPSDGATGVSTTGELWIRYTHNVADAYVCDINMAYVSLQTMDGEEVAAEVWVKDTQLYFEYRQYIYITPDEPLDYETTYQIVVFPGVVAKNDIHVTTEIEVVTFTTGAEAVPPSDDTSETVGGTDDDSGDASNDSDDSDTADSNADESDKSDDTPAETNTDLTAVGSGSGSDLGAASSSGDSGDDSETTTESDSDSERTSSSADAGPATSGEAADSPEVASGSGTSVVELSLSGTNAWGLSDESSAGLSWPLILAGVFALMLTGGIVFLVRTPELITDPKGVRAAKELRAMLKNGAMNRVEGRSVATGAAGGFAHDVAEVGESAETSTAVAAHVVFEGEFS